MVHQQTRPLRAPAAQRRIGPPPQYYSERWVLNYRFETRARYKTGTGADKLRGCSVQRDLNPSGIEPGHRARGRRRRHPPAPLFKDTGHQGARGERTRPHHCSRLLTRRVSVIHAHAGRPNARSLPWVRTRASKRRMELKSAALGHSATQAGAFSRVRRPGIEPGPRAWKARILTTALSTPCVPPGRVCGSAC